MDQSCSTYPITLPGGAVTSIVCRQHGNQQELQRSGRLKCSTSFWNVSMIFMSNARAAPQHMRLQQPVSSAAQYTFWPSVFLIVYLFAVSKPVKASSSSTFWCTSSWSMALLMFKLRPAA
uniref:Uncharacterized protein n=1 Tax=Anopheles atroparvus TaxID=41427 RepID=A0A182JHK0_ANOAO